MRITTCLIVLVTVGVAALGPSAAAARASVPSTRQALVWQQVCEHAAKGQVSPQPALACTHSGFPMWSERTLALLQHVCEKSFDGTFVYRSEFPVELATCFVD